VLKLQKSHNVYVLQFMPWKKSYHRLLKNDAESERMMLEQMKLADMVQPDHYLPSLVRLVLRHQFCDVCYVCC